MLNYIKRLFSKSGEGDGMEIHLPTNASATFELKVDNVVVGKLHCENGEWEFKYTEEFKSLRNKYNYIAGFSNLDKVYHNETLWPFF